MSQRQQLRDVVKTMPTRELGTLQPLDEDPSLQVAVERPIGYVWPELQFSEDSATSAPVLIIRAPGAMGKSMAAEAIAAELDAPRVDLSKMRVGSNSLTGMLFKSLGSGEAAQYLFALSQGHVSLILDGLDEAQLQAGSDHFWSFLEDVASLLRGATACNQVILLGRPDSTIAAELAMESFGIPFQVAELAPLGRAAASELIGLVLDSHTVDGQPYTVHRVHAGPFAQFEEMIVSDIANALDPKLNTGGNYWPEVDYFLGYPPVLQALAKRMAVNNPQAELQQVRESRAAHADSLDRGQLLRQIVETILDRESGKVREQLGKSLAIGTSNPERTVLYTREEQTLRVIAHVAKMPLDIQSPAMLSGSERLQYEQQLEAFVPDHPLIANGAIANIVFSDYLRAFVAVADTAALHGVNRNDLMSACEAPGPFFVHFVSGLSLDANTSQRQAIGEDIVDDLIKSYIAGSGGGAAFTLISGGAKNKGRLLLGQGDEPIAGVAGFAGLSREGAASSLTFSVSMSTGVVELSGPLTRAFIVLPTGGLVLDSPVGELELGPGVVLMVGSLEIRSQTVAAVATDDTGAVVMIADEFSGNPKVRIAPRSPDSLVVSWPDCWHPWKAFHRDLRPTVGEYLDGSLVLIGIRRILTSFKQSASDEPSLYYEMLDNLIVGKNELLRALLLRLMELDIIYRQGSQYYLRLSVLTPYGVSYAALRGSHFADALRKLVEVVVQSEAVQKLIRIELGPQQG